VEGNFANRAEVGEIFKAVVAGQNNICKKSTFKAAALLPPFLSVVAGVPVPGHRLGQRKRLKGCRFVNSLRPIVFLA
jgi:hypothetical protein